MVNISSKKSLSLLSLVMINIIAIDSLRNLPVSAASGFTLVCYYVLAYLLFLIPCALVTAELATHYPKTGGAYVWVREAFGKRAGLTAIWLQWIYNVFWYPTILAFVAANIAYLIDPALVNSKIYMVSMIVGLFTVATLVNGFGIKTSATMSIVSAIVGTIIPMLVIIVMGVIWVFKHQIVAIDMSLNSVLPHTSMGNNAAFFVIVMFSVFGLEMSATHAESVKKPEKNYPKALLISSIFIVLTLILASLAIAIVIPNNELNIITGLDQAFELFFSSMHLSFLLPLIVVAIVIGSFGSVATWVIGPTKGLMVAAKDGSLPSLFSYQNRFNSPVVILVLQAIMVFVLCGFFVIVNSFNTSYWILSDLTAQLAIVFYLFFFAAGAKLHKNITPKPNTFHLTPWAMNLACVTGFSTCLFAFFVGFIPPKSIAINNLLTYELILIGCIITFTLIPCLLVRKKRAELDEI